MKFLSQTLAVLLVLLLTTSFLQVALAAAAAAPDSGNSCDYKCSGRCAKAGKQDRCIRYCKICCVQCNCVPSGTYGNKDECPCYRDMVNYKTKKPKCP